MWGVASQGCLFFFRKQTIFFKAGAPVWGVASQGRFFLPKATFFKAGSSGVWRCLAGTFFFFFKQKRPFSKQGAPVWGVAWQGRFFSENDPFSFLDIAF